MNSKYIIALLLMFSSISTFSQDWEIISFEADPIDLRASTEERIDKNENPCALLKISIDSNNVEFSGDMIIGDVKKEGGYWLVYVPEGTRYLTIIANNLPIDLDFSERNIDPQRKVTYILKLGKKGPKTKTVYIEKEPIIKTVYVEKEPKIKLQFALKPVKKRFNMYVMSGFSNRLGFGVGLGGNISYFNFTIDGGGTLGTSGINDGYLSSKDLKNVCEISEGVFEMANMQFTVTPGINLKYFIAGCGIGTMINKQLSTTDRKPYGTSIWGEEANKSRLSIRPTLTGYIPFFDDEDSFMGLSVTAGYTMVSGLSKMNHFVIGIGFFF